MRVLVCARVCALVVAIGFAVPAALAEPGPAVAPAAAPTPSPAPALNAAQFWRAVQAKCDTTAAKPPSALSLRIAQTAIDEFTNFDGHKVDVTGRLFRFGLTEAEHTEEEGGGPSEQLSHLGWRQVMKYWRTLFGDDFASKLEVRGYRDASTAPDSAQQVELIRTDAATLMRAADAATDPEVREVLRETAIRAAIVDTPWSAAFISYVIRHAGVPDNGFQFSNAHRAYIYEAFATSAAELSNTAGNQVYRACPINSTRPRVGDMICQQREPTLVAATDEAVRERIRAELASGTDTRSIRRTHCDVIASIDAQAGKIYVIGGNVSQSVTARKLYLRGRDLMISENQRGTCGGPGNWTMPSAGPPPPPSDTCSLNDRKRFVLMQVR